jgi:hypothetical protein
MDPTVFCVRSLDKWLPPVDRDGLLFFRNPGADRLISNWFIASQPGNRSLETLYHRLCEYWNSKRPDRIRRNPGALEYRIGRIINRNPTMTRLWMSWPLRRLLQTTPHMIYHYLVNDLVARDPDFAGALQAMPRFSAAEAHLLQQIGLLERASPEIVEKIEHASSPLFKLNWRLPDQAAPDSVLSKLASLLPTQTLERDEKAQAGHV